MAVLIVAEKPSVGISIAKILGAKKRNDGYIEGNGYVVSWCVGHLIGLAEPGEYGERYAEKFWRVENLPIIPDDWIFAVNKDTKKQYDTLKKLMNSKDITEIVCATDAGREGECIFRYVYHKAGCRKPFKRLWISSLEESAIIEGFKKLRDGRDFDNLYASGFCRARADWLVGMNGSRLFSAIYRTPFSVGRVQTPTLAMIAERDYKVLNFVKEQYFTVNLDCGFPAVSERIDDLTEAEKIKSACQGKSAAVTTTKRSKKSVNPPRLYDLTTLQREANRLFSFSARCFTGFDSVVSVQRQAWFNKRQQNRPKSE
jgi:DNA topoisomerase-3